MEESKSLPSPPVSEIPFAKMNARQRKKHRRDIADDIVGEFLLDSGAGRARKRFEELMEALYKLGIKCSSPQAQVAAINALLDRGVGKVAISEEETAALEKAGIRMVFVQRPEVDAEVVEQSALPEARPEFEEAEESEQL